MIYDICVVVVVGVIIVVQARLCTNRAAISFSDQAPPPPSFSFYRASERLETETRPKSLRRRQMNRADVTTLAKYSIAAHT